MSTVPEATPLTAPHPSAARRNNIANLAASTPKNHQELSQTRPIATLLLPDLEIGPAGEAPLATR